MPGGHDEETFRELHRRHLEETGADAVLDTDEEAEDWRKHLREKRAERRDSESGDP